MNPLPLELNEDEDHHHHLSTALQPSSSSSSLSVPIHFNHIQEQGLFQQEIDHPILEAEGYKNSIKLSIWKKENGEENQCENSSVKWMSSKMRMMKKMMNSDKMIEKDTPPIDFPMKKHASSSHLETDNSCSNTSYINTIRVCSDCNTTKTPLWRSGPRGPKSLCNACGIRQRKARRAAAAAAATGTIVDAPSMKKKVQHKEKRPNNSEVLPFKKRCKLITTTTPSCSKKKLCFEDFTIRLSENSTCPQELKEAAIVLMALSYGLVHG